MKGLISGSRHQITIKLMSIGFLVIVLLIPSSWIQNLMQERQWRAEGVMQEVSDKWSAKPLSGLILVVPYKVHKKIERGNNGIEDQEYGEKISLFLTVGSVNGLISFVLKA